MTHLIRSLAEADIAQVVELSLLAWEPVFASFREIMGPTIFNVVYPDWRGQQAEVVRTFCQAQEHRTVWVAERGGQVAGFLVCDLSPEKKTADVQLLAVHPAYQRQGIADALNAVALDHMRAHGMLVAYVGTGGDPGHAAARRAYEKAGYHAAVPAVHYFQEL
jgi:ribosomal protein S18 acetylase RimI-like enzyme